MVVLYLITMLTVGEICQPVFLQQLVGSVHFSSASRILQCTKLLNKEFALNFLLRMEFGVSTRW